MFNLPASSKLPRGLSLSAAELATEDAMIVAHNAGFRKVATTYYEAGVSTTIVDVNCPSREVAADQGTFGLKVLDVPLYTLDRDDRPLPTGITSRADADEVAYFDPVLAAGGNDAVDDGAGSDLVFGDRSRRRPERLGRQRPPRWQRG